MTEPLRFATYLAPSVERLYGLVAERVGLELGVPTELVRGRDTSAIERGEEHVAFLCSPPALALVDRDEPVAEILAAPILIGARYGEAPAYFSDVIVRRGDPAAGFAELGGRSWAYNESSSHSGYGVTRAKLVEIGAVRGFFSRVVRTGFHQRSLRMVASGAVDASAIDSQVLELELVRHPRLRARLQVIDALGPSTIQPVVVSTRLDPGLRRAIRDAIVRVGEEPQDRQIMSSCLVMRFVPASATDYDDIRAMMRDAESSGLEGFGPEVGSNDQAGGPPPAGTVASHRRELP